MDYIDYLIIFYDLILMDLNKLLFSILVILATYISSLYFNYYSIYHS